MSEILLISWVFFAVTCTVLSLQNGQINYNDSLAENGGYPVDSVTSFRCNYGYILSVSNSIHCNTSGDLDQQTPLCNESNENN